MRFISPGFVTFWLGAGLFVSTLAPADEDIFAFTYTTDLLPKGKWEVEHWTTGRWGKETGTYNVVDFREELEYGVTDNFQLSLYFNHHHVEASADLPAEDPRRPGRRLPGSYVTGGEDVHPGKNPATPYHSYHFESISVKGIYRLTSPTLSRSESRSISNRNGDRKNAAWKGKSFCKKMARGPSGLGNEH